MFDKPVTAEMASARELVLYDNSKFNPSGVEKIEGQYIRSINSLGVVVYLGGAQKTLIPWHRVKELTYQTHDYIVTAFEREGS